MSLTLKVLKATTFKRKPVPSSELTDAEKQSIDPRELELTSYTFDGKHLHCIFSKDTFQNTNDWYVFGEHAEVYRDSTKAFPNSLPEDVKLSIPYKSQRDNELNPDGACNVTSLAMCLEFLGASRQTDYGQFEDELYEYAENNGLSRHEPTDLARIVEAYGCKDDFRTDVCFDDLKAWLAEGKPAVIHGYFTDFGHIVVVAGYDHAGCFIHDPYGEWNDWGYDRNEPGWHDNKGEFIHYSYNMLARLCKPDGNFWVHFISKA